jgi:putative FmdB family regulatory protein
MPLYEYQCQACGRRFELIRRHSDQDVERCPHCDQGPVTRLQSAPAFQFKGSGWYITDYARQGQGSEKGEKIGDKGGDKTSDSTAATASGAKPESGGDGTSKSHPAAPAASSGGATPSKD